MLPHREGFGCLVKSIYFASSTRITNKKNEKLRIVSYRNYMSAVSL